jgi:glycosyltransferase involved in cell wall biosynthesis
MSTPAISVTILTKDSARHLARVLEALKIFDDVVMLDNGSADETLAIAKKFPNVRVFTTTFKGFGPLHNEASALARHDWILSLDSDEVLTVELSREIAELALDARTVYSVSRRNYFNGKWIRWCGWHPDWCARLYNKTQTRFSENLVHEGVITKNFRETKLAAPLNHFPYETISDFIEKTQRYSDLFARQNQGKKKSSLVTAISRGTWAFLKAYIFKRGFMGGREGFIISAHKGFITYFRYLKLLEANERTARTSNVR